MVNRSVPTSGTMAFMPSTIHRAIWKKTSRIVPTADESSTRQQRATKRSNAREGCQTKRWPGGLTRKHGAGGLSENGVGGLSEYEGNGY